MSVSENWSRLRARVEAAAERAGRRPDEVTVVAVSKTFSANAVREAHAAGLRVFGENYVQEALGKMAELPRDLDWHFIGHLQSNKARHIIGKFSLVHSVDSIHLARELDRRAEERGLTQAILLQVNIADEETKSGFEPEQVLDGAAAIAELHHLQPRGLMTIGPLTERPEEVRWVFAELRRLRDQVSARFPSLPWTELSMGMTGDFEVAIEEGATLIRVGRAIFGDRPSR